jgi:Protein of unknown function (DUF3443)/Bacterial Ig-like domain (group 2)
MKSNRLALLFLVFALATGCSGGSGGGSNAPAKTLVSISVTPSTASIALGMMQQFIATGVYSDNSSQDVTTQVTWSSSVPAVATINNVSGKNGLAASVATGTTTISAASGNITSTNSPTLTVTTAKLVSITVTPADATIPAGTTQQYTAWGIYTNSTNSQRDITTSVAWSSSAPDVATISASGLATSPTLSVVTASTATTVITATQGNVSGSAILTVTGGSAQLAANVMTITVNGSLCDATNTNSAGYINKPCVSVKVCTPGSTTACQIINDILLDTGSYGLRIFKQAFTTLSLSSLPSVTSDSGQPLATCAQFADGSAEWGAVQLADVVLGNEPAVTVPVQVIDATFGTVPASCGSPDLNPSAAGLNGILGVGVFAQDCGPGCAPDPNNPNNSNSNNGFYYACDIATSICTGTTVPLSNQVTNPVISLPTDSNGVIVQLPSVPASGTPSINGILVLGIDTRSNNSSSGVTRYDADRSGEIVTISSDTAYGSIIDSGSNGLFFTPPPGNLLPDCGGANAAWFCPSSLTSLSATNEGFSGTPSNNVMFQIENFTSLTSGSNMVFSDIGGGVPAIANIFDWGLPFYFGRNVYVGFENPPGSSNGQYFAY